MEFVTFGTYDVWVINNTGNFTFGSFDVFFNFWCLCRKLPMTTGTCVPHPSFPADHEERIRDVDLILQDV
jgi:hypothetical protein